MKKIKLKSQPKWIARAMFWVWAVTWLLLALHTHPIGWTNALNEDWTSEFMHYEEVAWKGTITICDPDSGGTRCITMMDRNLWATKAWTWCSESDTWACGNHYQWWNNYGFANPWENTGGDSIISWAIEFDATGAKVDASVYWPWNYYSSGTFITDNAGTNPKQRNGGDWAFTWNNNLRWWSWDDGTNNYWYDTGTMQAINVTWRQWPCPEWYHVPSQWEQWTLFKYWVDNYTGTTSDTVILSGTYPLQSFSGYYAASIQFQNDFKIPFAGNRSLGALVLNVWRNAYLWSSSPSRSSGSWGGAGYFILYSGSAALRSITRANGMSVRCFKDTSLTFPFIIVMDGETVIRSGEVKAWNRLPNEAIQKMNDYANSKTGYSFSGWYDEISSKWRNTGSIVRTRLNLSGVRTLDVYSITYDLTGWEYSTGESNPSSYTYETTGFTLVNPVRNWYTFSWWTRSGQTEPQTTVTILKQIGDKKFTANWTPIHDANGNWIADEEDSFLVTWKDGDAIIGTSLVLYWEMPTPGFTPTKNWYNFAGWTPEIQAMTWDVEYSAIWTQIPRSSGGWGVRLRKDNCPGGDFSDSYYDWKCAASNKDSSNGGKHGSIGEFQFDTSKFDPNYSDEMNQAYQFAYHYWITTKNTIVSANMTWKLTRIAMAKMLSQYAVNVLWKTPNKTRIKRFEDVSTKLDSQYNDGVMLAYQLWIMWINMWSKFKPNSYVKRAEFATALSRLLYDTPDWDFAWTVKYYVPHISKLAYEWIISKTDPTIL